MKHSLVPSILCALLVLSGWYPAAAQEPRFKQLPPAGIGVDEEVKSQLTGRVARLRRRIESEVPADQRPHVEVLTRAVELAVEQNLFYKPDDPEKASRLLDEARRRIVAAGSGVTGLRLMGFDASRSDEPQSIVGGFHSDIDDSVQPFGLVVPAGFDPSSRRRSRLDVWLHGRGDTKTEVPFLIERMTKPGEYTPENAFVLHPFGRHCNAFKFAGETDVYEAIDATRSLVRVDDDRIAIRGFSMGGAGCWHLGVHDPGNWFAVNPGAGFVDSLVYQGWGDDPPFPLDDVQRKLLHWYDVLPWAGNLRNTNVIAYSGEVDKQKQAADRVAAACKELNFDWPYVIGEGMGHKIDPPSKQIIDAQLAKWADEATGLKNPATRMSLDFTTSTLRYPSLDWLTVTGLRQHWEPSRLRSRRSVAAGESATFQITTDGITSFAIDLPDRDVDLAAEIDGQPVTLADQDPRVGFQASVVRRGDRWRAGQPDDGSLRKRPGLQGPIDDALTDRFLFVVPSRPARHGRVERWIRQESAYAQKRWSDIMRGDVRVVRDTEVTPQMMKDNHLICFGDFTSNDVLRRAAAGLPVTWTRDQISMQGNQVDAANHVAIFCYPNPLSPNRYLVANSGLTFREFSNNSNSRQIAMLPDWAIGAVNDAADRSIFPAEIVAKGFFDESWQ